MVGVTSYSIALLGIPLLGIPLLRLFAISRPLTSQGRICYNRNLLSVTTPHQIAQDY